MLKFRNKIYMRGSMEIIIRFFEAVHVIGINVNGQNRCDYVLPIIYCVSLSILPIMNWFWPDQVFHDNAIVIVQFRNHFRKSEHVTEFENETQICDFPRDEPLREINRDQSVLSLVNE